MIRQFFSQIKIFDSKSYHQETIVDAVAGDLLEFVVVDNEHKFVVVAGSITDQKNGLLHRVGKDFDNQAVLDLRADGCDGVHINEGFVDSIVDRPRFELDIGFRNGFDL